MWHLAKDISVEICKLFPPKVCRRAPGFRGQITQAADSVGSNIAEGCGRDSDKQFRQYLSQSMGSLFEVDHWLDTAVDKGMLARASHRRLTRRTAVLRRMIVSFKKGLDDQDPPASN